MVSNMNIFLFEFNKRLKSLIIWLIVIVGLLGIFLIYYPVFLDARDSITAIIDNMNVSFLTLFGLNLDTIFSFKGFYSFCYLYIALFIAIFASLDAIEVFGREKQSHCCEFLYVKPISRKRIFFEKLCVILVNMAIISIVYNIVLMLAFKVNGSALLFEEAIKIILGFVLNYLLFMSIGILYTFLAKKIRNISGVATTIAIVAFVLTSIVNLLKEEWLSIFAPFKYFDVSDLLINNSFALRNILAFILVFGFCMLSSYVICEKKDIKVN